MTPGTVEAKVGASSRGANRGSGPLVRADDQAIFSNVQDGPACRDRGQAGVRDDGRTGIDDRQRAAKGAAAEQHDLSDRRQRGGVARVTMTFDWPKSNPARRLKVGSSLPLP